MILISRAEHWRFGGFEGRLQKIARAVSSSVNRDYSYKLCFIVPLVIVKQILLAPILPRLPTPLNFGLYIICIDWMFAGQIV